MAGWERDAVRAEEREGGEDTILLEEGLEDREELLEEGDLLNTLPILSLISSELVL